ncbi:NAD(P)H-dependent oxidoreductase [Bosea thiooxidans]|nr:NAD(P)H-dependent oxidoreductase [Bosea sp. (in: a-proteobacteria)]
MPVSDTLTDELLASDLLVIATPMWNFGVPSALKAWIDWIIRPGRTVRYAESGVLGTITTTRFESCGSRRNFCQNRSPLRSFSR